MFCGKELSLWWGDCWWLKVTAHLCVSKLFKITLHKGLSSLRELKAWRKSDVELVTKQFKEPYVVELNFFLNKCALPIWVPKPNEKAVGSYGHSW